MSSLLRRLQSQISTKNQACPNENDGDNIDYGDDIDSDYIDNNEKNELRIKTYFLLGFPFLSFFLVDQSPA
jgi:hypothetical protein